MFTSLLFMFFMSASSTLVMPKENQPPSLDDERQTLGQGQSGIVEKVSILNEHKSFALKTIKSTMEDGICSINKFVNNEITFLSNLKHKNIVELQSFWTKKVSGSECEIKLLLELCDYDMQDFTSYWEVDANNVNSVESNRNYPEHFETIRDSPSTFINHTVTDILGALAYMHSKGIYHLDLKPSNIVLKKLATPKEDRLYEIKLIDFTWSSTSPEVQNNNLGTMAYIPSSAVPNAVVIVLLHALRGCLLELESERECSDLPYIVQHFNEYKDQIDVTDQKLVNEVLKLVNRNIKRYGLAGVVSGWLTLIRTADDVAEESSRLKGLMDARVNQLNNMQFKSSLLDIYALGKSLIQMISLLYDGVYPFKGYQTEAEIQDILYALPCDRRYKPLIASMMTMDEKLSAETLLQAWNDL